MNNKNIDMWSVHVHDHTMQQSTRCELSSTDDDNVELTDSLSLMMMLLLLWLSLSFVVVEDDVVIATIDKNQRFIKYIIMLTHHTKRRLRRRL
jgi:hypothetical protein